jgi:hypothetical protein
MNEQQQYFQKLCGVTHPSNLKVAVVNYNSEVDRYNPGKRYNADKYEIHDERNVAVNEVVFDFDWGSYKANYDKAKEVVNVLNNRGIPSLVCATGGKGIHIHIFFNKINFKTEEGKKAFKNALRYNFSFKHIRLWLWNTILDEAGIEEKFRSKQVDPKVIKFNYYQGTTHLIRDIGGRKYTKNVDGVWIPHYKTIISPEEFNSKKKIISRFDDVKYPEKIECFDIDEHELLSYLYNFVNIQKRDNVEELTNERIKGKYIELDGILKVREGLNEGNRNAGASILAIACRIDNLPKKEAYEIMQDYVNNCSQTGSPFSVDEANQWIDWIYNHEKPFWNCQALEDLGVHERELCEHCQMRNREALELLTKPTILDQIKEVLDMEVVGEINMKMLMFLLILSKDFPSPTGRPNWNIYESEYYNQQ